MKRGKTRRDARKDVSNPENAVEQINSGLTGSVGRRMVINRTALHNWQLSGLRERPFLRGGYYRCLDIVTETDRFVCVLEFEEIDLVVAAFVLLLLHATLSTGMIFIIGQCHGSSRQFAHAVMRL